MERFIKFLALFFLGAGTTLFINASSFPKKLPTTIKPIELTKEATSTSPLITLGNQETVVVKRVIDGDTIELTSGRRVRYIGIDTPEIVDPRKPVECYGREAKAQNQALVEGKDIRLEKDISETDKYGRLLRYIYVGDVFVNDYLVRQGFAHASTYPPDVKYASQFREAEKEARENNRGLWSGCTSSSTIQQLNNVTITPTVEGTQIDCIIKGNISATGEKVYHLPGCGSYAKTVIDQSRGERWFCTEDEAVQAGWRKAKNCP